jgi:hypothetical protein
MRKLTKDSAIEAIKIILRNKSDLKGAKKEPMLESNV